MHSKSVSLFALLGAALVGHGALAAVKGHCPPLGPVLAAPVHPSDNPTVEAAVTKAKAYLDGRMAEWASLGVNNSALSVIIKSTHENVPLLEYHYTPTALDPIGVDEVNGDSVYRIASTTKLFPALAILKLKSRGVTWDDPVTKHLPNLRKLKPPVQNGFTTVQWDEITLGSLASHLSGLGADILTDLSVFNLPVSLQDLGLPPKDDPPPIDCSGYFGARECTDKEFRNALGLRPPIYAPYETPVYSNIGFAILGWVVEAVAKTTFEKFVKKEILDPLGMHNTFYSKPKDSLGVIPEGETFWNISIVSEAAAGTYYSSAKDLLAFADGILAGKILTPSEVRKWLKPSSLTSAAGGFVGMPWEIYRANNITSDRRLVDVYTKGGDVITYHSTIALVPDYDFELVALVAGNSGQFLQQVQGDILKLLIPALEQAGKDEAKVNYAGTFVDESTNSSITFDVDGEPGLHVSKYFVRGVDIIGNYTRIQFLPGPVPNVPIRLRLYPTSLESDTEKMWHGLFDVDPGEEAGQVDDGFPWVDFSCSSWGAIDRLVYQLQGLDSFHFHLDKKEDGSKFAKALELPAYKVKMIRQGQQT